MLFLIQNIHSREGRKLPKHDKFTNFTSITWINVGGFLLSFDYKIISGSGVTRHQT